MFGVISDLTDRIFGRGDYSVAIPTMDGPLQPNQALENEARTRAEAPVLDNLVWTDRELLFTSGKTS